MTRFVERRSISPRSRSIASSVLVSLAIAWCSLACDHGAKDGSRAQETTPPTPAQETIVTEGQRIVAGTTAAAEYLRFLVKPERVAAIPEQVTAFSTLPFGESGWEKVERMPRYSADPILTAHADLVLTHVWQEPETTSILRDRGVPVLVIDSASSWDDIAKTIERLGKILHVEKDAQRELLRRGNIVDRLQREAAKRKPVRVLVYSNDGSAGWAAGKHTTVDAVLAMAGFVNAATEAGIEGHARIDFDRLLVIDPDAIVVPQPHGSHEPAATQKTLETTAVLAEMRAVKEKHVVAIDDALLSSDSPTMVDAADMITLRIDDVLAGRK